MTEQQVTTPTKKQATAKTASTVASKPKAAKSATANKPAANMPVAKKTATAESKPASAEKTKAKPTPEERYRMVETAAYFIAERNGFQGDSTKHWAAAEIEIAAKLRQ